MNMFAFILVIWLVGCKQTASAQNMCICLEPFPSKDKPFNQTVHMASANDGSKRIFLVDLAGFVWIVQKGQILSKPFANITSDVDQSKKETGLQTIAFHPGFKTNKKIYLFYTAKQTPLGNTTRLVVEEFRVKDGDNNTVDTTAFRRLLLQFDAQDVFHFGGKMWFDENGLLYIAVGDTKFIADGNYQPQNMSSMIGKILRIDVNRNDTVRGKPYSIPADNPFVNEPGVIPEVYAWGMRNPWQCTVDKGDPKTKIGKGRVFCADIGNKTEEEINLIEKGKNYGWNVMEGKTNVCPSCVKGGPANISFTDPIFSYAHGPHGLSVIGGFMYRGCHNPALQGHYIYGDYGYDKGLFALREDETTGKWIDRNLTFCAICVKPRIKFLISFGEDEKGEPYVIGSETDNFSGVWKSYVYKVVHRASFKRIC